MFFKEKYERARKVQLEKVAADRKEYEEYNGEKLYEPTIQEEMEKGDMFALMLSGVLTILPIIAILLFVIVFLASLIFRIL